MRWCSQTSTAGSYVTPIGGHGCSSPQSRSARRPTTNFPSITPHDLRHTAASLAISAGANVKAVQRMLGHAKASMTLDVYADLFDEDLDGVADRLDTAIRTTADQLRTGNSEVK